MMKAKYVQESVQLGTQGEPTIQKITTRMRLVITRDIQARLRALWVAPALEPTYGIAL